MGRPKGYDRDQVLTAARDLFWERGYEGASISELEGRTGLNRSSLYQEFGSKRDLFEAALQCYLDQVIAVLLTDLKRPDASLDTVASLFRRLAALFLAPGGVSRRGCLMVNATAELAAGDERARVAAANYRDQLRAVFTGALNRAAERGEIRPDVVRARARLLASALMGIWLTVRIDAADASKVCENIADEIASWRDQSVSQLAKGACAGRPTARSCSNTKPGLSEPF